MDDVKKDCDTCKHEGKDFRYEEPCKRCIDESDNDGVPLFWRKKEVSNE